MSPEEVALMSCTRVAYQWQLQQATNRANELEHKFRTFDLREDLRQVTMSNTGQALEAAHYTIVTYEEELRQLRHFVKYHTTHGYPNASIPSSTFQQLNVHMMAQKEKAETTVKRLLEEKQQLFERLEDTMGQIVSGIKEKLELRKAFESLEENDNSYTTHFEACMAETGRSSSGSEGREHHTDSSSSLQISSRSSVAEVDEWD